MRGSNDIRRYVITFEDIHNRFEDIHNREGSQRVREQTLAGSIHTTITVLFANWRSGARKWAALYSALKIVSW